MAVHVIRKGLDLPISGAPEQQIHPGAPVTRVAVMADDFPLHETPNGKCRSGMS
jgi:Na+-transporting NADH:ubiquinone oxidoreductase subunit A